MNRRFYLGIPSRSRQKRVQGNNDLWLHDIPEARWFAPRDEVVSYRAAGAKKVFGQVPGHNFSKVINQIIRRAQKMNRWAVVMDDDLRQMKYCEIPEDFEHSGNLRYSEYAKLFRNIGLRESIEIMIDACIQTGSKLGGVSSNDNKGFAYNSISRSGEFHPTAYIRSSLMVISPDNELRCDPALRTKMDYDYTLQHIDHYGRVCRITSLVPSWGYKTLDGGFKLVRSDEMEYRSIDILKKRWNGLVRVQKDKPTEVLLNTRIKTGAKRG